MPVAHAGPDPDASFRSGLRALAAARVLSWVLLPLCVAIGIGGGIILAEADNQFATPLYDAGWVLSGVGALGWLAVGAALWATLGVWCSKTGAAARASGNARSSSSHMAWWGFFVPFAAAVLPFLAYREAARYVRAVSRYGQIRNGGDGWTSTPLPGLLLPWWLLSLLALGCFSGFGSVDEADEVAEGVLLVLMGVFGTLGSVLGALTMGSLLREARRGPPTGPPAGMPHSS